MNFVHIRKALNHFVLRDAWTVRTGAIESVIENYEALISTTAHDDYGRLAGDVLAQLERFEIFCGLKLCHLVFAATEEVSLLLHYLFFPPEL